MAITIGAVKLNSFSLAREAETGEMKLTGQYILESNTGVVLAKQGFNGYSDVKVALSQETSKLQASFIAALAKDVQNTLGLGEV